MFEYDVVLSFAGEQREQVDQVAACLKAAGITVFYDRYEKANLWGKNLYDHLSDVYQHKGRYCVMFLSKEYATKVWTTLERQNAQARAITEKGEYILPVRMDETVVPGLPITVGCLTFSEEGVSGICGAVVEKLGHSVAEKKVTDTVVKCTSSPLMFINVADKGFAMPNVVSCEWGDEITLIVEEDDSTSFFSQLRGERLQATVAYGFDVAQARVKAATRSVQGLSRKWTIVLSDPKSDFSVGMESSVSGLSADQIAERRCRRILLDEFPAPEESAGSAGRMQSVMEEVHIRGLSTTVQIDKSKLPGIYAILKGNPQGFVECAWLLCVVDLKMSACVETIDRLSLSLTGDVLEVNFSGRRKKFYSNKEAYRIAVSGKLTLEQWKPNSP